MYIVLIEFEIQHVCFLSLLFRSHENRKLKRCLKNELFMSISLVVNDNKHYL